MSKLYVGIDFSYNSCGVTFIHKKSVSHMCIFNKYTINKKELTDEEAFEESPVLHFIDGMDCSVILTNRESVPQAKSIGLLAWERIHLAQVAMFSDLVFNTIATYIQLHYRSVQPKSIMVGIENYTHSRNTNNIIEMVEFTAPLKKDILKNILGFENLENFFIATGPTIKKFAGKGDYDKYDMFQAFLKEDINNEFIKTLKANEDKTYIPRIKKGKSFNDMISPISDIIDSYFVAKWMVHEVEGN